MQQLEAQLESYEQKLKSAKEAAEQSEAKLAAANEANKALQAEVQQSTKMSGAEETAAAIAELSKKHEAEIAGMVTRQQHDETVHALQACHSWSPKLDVFLCLHARIARIGLCPHLRRMRRRRGGV